MAVLPGAEAFTHDGGDIGVLVCHGFTGCPQSVRPWATQFATAGYTVRLPLLPGHGTAWQDMNRSTWRDWYGAVDTEFTALSTRCSRVFVAGLSMGGCLALRLAQQHGDAVSGVLLVNPAVRIDDRRLRALPVLRRLVPSIPGIGSDVKKPGSTELAYDRTPLNALASLVQMYAVVVPDLPKVTQPVILFRSPEDHVVPASSSKLVLDRISSADVTEILCEDSYHVATLDNDAERIAKESLGFISRLTSTGETR